MKGLLLIGLIAGGIYLFTRKKELPKRLSPCPPMGDVDGDGYVSIEDADLISQHFAGLITLTPGQIERAEVRGKPLSAADAGVIGMYVAGHRDTFPVCKIV